MFSAVLLAGGVAGDSGAAREIGSGAGSGVPILCWQAVDTYCPPDFEGYFPDSSEGASALRAFWASPVKDKCGEMETLDIVRHGLRRYRGDPAPVLRWLGRQFIGNHTPQSASAIELMYHAAGGPSGGDSPGTRGPAIYFGLSAVRPMTPAVLRALVEIAVRDDDPKDLSRILWGMGEQAEEALPYIAPFLESGDPAGREKAEAVGEMLRGELKAFDWARQRKLEYVEQNYRAALPRIETALRTGDSQRRGETLALVQREGVMTIMNFGFIQAFAACAADPDPAIRSTVAQMAGEHWIGSDRNPHVDAIALLLALSRDSDRDVRHEAVYFGLSMIPVKGDGVVRRMLEMAFEDRDAAFRARVAWGLRTQRDRARALLDAYVAGGDPLFAAAAMEVYADMAGTVRKR